LNDKNYRFLAIIVLRSEELSKKYLFL